MDSISVATSAKESQAFIPNIDSHGSMATTAFGRPFGGGDGILDMGKGSWGGAGDDNLRNSELSRRTDLAFRVPPRFPPFLSATMERHAALCNTYIYIYMLPPPP